MDGLKLRQDYRATTRRQFTFYHYSTFAQAFLVFLRERLPTGFGCLGRELSESSWLCPYGVILRLLAAVRGGWVGEGMLFFSLS